MDKAKLIFNILWASAILIFVVILAMNTEVTVSTRKVIDPEELQKYINAQTDCIFDLESRIAALEARVEPNECKFYEVLYHQPNKTKYQRDKDIEDWLTEINKEKSKNPDYKYLYYKDPND